MAYYFPEGSSFQYSKTFAAAKTISALTNASPAVATSTAHGYSDGDEVLLLSGWEDATNAVYQVDQLSADTFSLVDLNTASTTTFPAGSGVGTAQKISSWQQLPQALNKISSSGGDPKFSEIQLLARRTGIKVPTGFNPVSISIPLAWDPDNAIFKDMLDISRTSTPVAIKGNISGGASVYGYGYISVSDMPTFNAGQVNEVTVAMTITGRLMSYVA